MYETLQYASEGAIGVLTLNRPDRLNAIGLAMAQDIDRLCAVLRDDRSLRALIVCGAGRVFCAGADIATLAAFDSVDSGYRFLAAIQQAMNALEALPVPTIAAVHGGAFGGGLELAIACDFRILGADVRMGVPEIKLGLIPGAGGTQRLSRLLPPALAREMLYLGEPINASTALAHGLVNAVVAPGEVMTEARAWAARIAALPPLALRSAKTLVHTAALHGLANGIDAERQACAYLMQSADAAEGLRAFLDKRAPSFEGR